jgi:hypothetical protein
LNRVKAAVAASVVAGSMLSGGIIGATVFGVTRVVTATNVAAVASPDTGSAAAPSGAFKPNEDPTHESGESAAREAQEDAGQRPTQP